ncbi:hypothetical protein G7068_15965 [Leucobacter viscericola]|uniref:Uncharacterized protein n=1 Tax=Leucobacter viscericola TaxID=2714935 RepID=A0A6G7XJ51_9MICO|nr:hypothetical protein [Leucobacter viscericola]QIK64542.1 hypothetical protein G7068_15965 [Leucobacter viscericola]
MSIKTPEQIADEIFNTDISIGQDDKPIIIAAIERDRAQRDIYELIAEALDERAHSWGEEMPKDAAEAIRSGNHDDIWSRFIEPMLNKMTEELGA